MFRHFNVQDEESYLLEGFRVINSHIPMNKIFLFQFKMSKQWQNHLSLEFQ